MRNTYIATEVSKLSVIMELFINYLRGEFDD